MLKRDAIHLVTGFERLYGEIRDSGCPCFERGQVPWAEGLCALFFEQLFRIVIGVAMCENKGSLWADAVQLRAVVLHVMVRARFIREINVNVGHAIAEVKAAVTDEFDADR